MNTITRLLLTALVTLLSVPANAGEEGRAYIFSYLVLDAPEKLSEEEMGLAMEGHFSNMGKLAERGALLISGPLVDPRIDETYRGLYVFDARDQEAGKALFNTDPAVKAGVFKPEMYVIECAQPLTELTRLEKEDEARRLADPDVPDEWVGRGYVLAIGPVDAQFTRTGAVLIDASMRPVEDDDASARRLLWLDARTVEEAEKLFEAKDPDAWSFYGWYGSRCVAQLGEIGP